MGPAEFTPIPPGGFDIAGSFDGVTTAVGQGGTPRIRYRLIARPSNLSERSDRRRDRLATVAIPAGVLEIEVCDCDSDEECGRILRAALAPYRQPG